MYSISLPQIEYFLTVAERKSISEAARVLFIAQPTITKWIRNLEAELDTKLFTRRYNGVELTAEGKFIYEKWRRLMDEMCLSIEELHERSSKLDSELRIGCLAGFNYDNILPELIRGFEKKYPGVQVTVHSYSFKELREKLQWKDLDCIFTMTFDLENIAGLSQRIVKELPLYIAISAEHPLATRGALNLIDVKDQVFYILSPDESSRGGDRVISACMRAGFKPREVRYVPNLPSMAMAIKQGNGVTICSDEIQIGSERTIKLFQTADLPLDSYVVAAWHAEGSSGATLRFIELTRY